jgi:DNA-binding IclR family transcriptional regulator
MVQNGNDKPTYPIESVDNALRLLGMFSTHERVRVSEASRELGVAHSTAHRLMQMLRYHEYVRQDQASKAYLPGPELVRVGLAVVARSDIRSVSRPCLQRLVDEVQESAHLVELQGSDAVFLDSVETSRALRIGSRTGVRLPAYATASGKVLLAALSPDARRRILPDEPLEHLTDRTTTTISALERELEDIKARGYASNFGESEPDVHAVAVPIVDGRGVTRAAITVSAPPSRLGEADVERVAQRAIAAAAEVGSALPG